MALPEQAYKPFQTGMDYLNQAAQTTQNAVSPESRDRAAARVRAGLDRQRVAGEREVMDQEAARGTANSGRADAGKARNTGNYYSALGQGLGEVESNWTAQSLQAGSQMGNLGQTAMTGAVAKQNADTNTANQYLQGGNVFSDPTGTAAQNFWGNLGLDVQGMSFFNPTGTTNSVAGPGGGTTVNTGTGGSTGTSPAQYYNPDGTINWQKYGTSLAQGFNPSMPVLYNQQAVQANPGLQQVLQYLQQAGFTVQPGNAQGKTFGQ